MMSKIMQALICLFLMTIIAPSGNAMIVMPQLPDHIAKVPVIVEGHIKLSDGKITLLVERFLKGSASNQISIKSDLELSSSMNAEVINPPGKRAIRASSIYWEPTLKFTNGESVILFLTSLNHDGTEAYLSGGDSGKWPKDPKKAGWHKTYLTDDMTRFGAVIDSMIHAMAGKGFEERARRIISMTKSPDEMLQLAGLQLMTSRVFSATLGDGNHWQKLTQITAFMLSLLKSENPEIKMEAAVVARYAPISVAAPALIPLLTDPGRNVSQRAASELGRVFGELKLPGPVVVPSELQFRDKLASVDVVQFRQNARNWSEAVWSAKADIQIAKDLVRLHKSLESGSALERESAQIYLDILNGSSIEGR